MKKLFTILCAGLLSFAVSAQTDAGNMMVSVNSNLTWSDWSYEGESVASSTALAGGVGYFLADNLAAMVGFDYSQASTLGVDGDAVTGWAIGARYYMNSMFGGVSYGSPAEDVSDINIQVGYSHMLTDNISLEPMFQYGMRSVDGESAGSTMAIRVGFGLYF